MNATLRNLLTGGFVGLGVSASEPTVTAVKNTIKIAGTLALVVAGVWIYSKVKK